MQTLRTNPFKIIYNSSSRAHKFLTCCVHSYAFLCGGRREDMYTRELYKSEKSQKWKPMGTICISTIPVPVLFGPEPHCMGSCFSF